MSEMVGTSGERAELALRYAETHPYMAAAPVGEPRPEALRSDAVIGDGYAVVPFGGKGESGWSAWFFEKKVMRDVFVRRYRRARPLTDLRSICRRQADPDQY